MVNDDEIYVNCIDLNIEQIHIVLYNNNIAKHSVSTIFCSAVEASTTRSQQDL